ncbi:hypothetical protein [Nocardioides sp. CFH 31398]|uniref:hypothetical protein n=1 Tax=Nocardioides sp. CFH 31398 TaxID=2919579 RepID=UPI001F066770|nr:hypothetical protein [Nocardioides sp. CFH 31398]MCH1867067.1 hypothetical protein [Nocardioides sp. CFH 31398]
MNAIKRQLLESGDIQGLLAYNRLRYGGFEMMARGYAAHGGILKALADGTDLNTIWAEFAQTLDLANKRRSALVDLFTFRTTRKGESVLQSPTGSSDFERSSEYGVPQAIRAEQALLPMGYTFGWFDLATRYTWKFLADASAGQVASLHNAALEADNRLTFKTVMNRLFNPAQGANDDGTPVYGLWNGSDGQTPPDHDGQSFDTSHSHYLTTQSTSLDPGDVEDLQNTVLHHGYGEVDGGTVVILANPLDAERIAGFRVGVNAAKFDFIASAGAPPYLTTETLVGSRPPEQFNGLKVLGQYGRALIVENRLIPVGYVVCLATSGSNSSRNPIALREHPSATLQGLIIVRGNVPDYPLIDSYYVHGLGTGIRHRGAAAIMQVTTSTTYTAPAAF